MLKYCFFSPIASPHQVRFCDYLRKYFDAEFYFYDRIGARQSFWAVPLGEHCHILPTRFKWRSRYFTLSVLKVLDQMKPDIIMLGGGFSIPSNYLAYRWGKRHGAKVVVQTERSRVMKTGKLRGYTLVWRFLRFLYRHVDLIMVTSSDAVLQFKDTFRFGERVRAGRYPSDKDRYYQHPLRKAKDHYTLIYPNRMTDIYNPLFMVEIFADVLKRYPKTMLKMNAAGELRPDVEALVKKLNISSSVEFLDDIKHWDDLGEIYKQCDIMVLPAKFSNGNYTVGECAISGMACLLSDKCAKPNIEHIASVVSENIIPLNRQRFVDRIVYYIEHPEEISKGTMRYRELYRPTTLSGTAEFYAQFMKDL